jgi:hypothetical protein
VKLGESSLHVRKEEEDVMPNIELHKHANKDLNGNTALFESELEDTNK